MEYKNLDHYYFDKEKEPLKYKQWLCLIRYLKEKDLYQIFKERAELYVKTYPEIFNGYQGVVPFMHQYEPEICLGWIHYGMSIKNKAVISKTYMQFSPLEVMALLTKVKNEYNEIYIPKNNT